LQYRIEISRKIILVLSIFRYVFRHLCFRRAHSVTESIPTPELPTGPVRVRFAPSPTGELHLGGLRTAMYNYLLAKRTNGTFVMRIEDTDQTRLVPGSAERLADALNWAGIPYDEGPSKDAGLGPYVQSERLPIYQQHAQQLLKNGHAYHCFCSEQRLEVQHHFVSYYIWIVFSCPQFQQQSMAKLQAKTGIRTGYDRFCAGLTPSEVQAKLDAKIPYTIRMKVPDGAVEVHDIIRGRIEFSSDDVNDQVLLKADGFPTYHLANVVDDHLMKITHVIRGEVCLRIRLVVFQCY
jgi:glutamyl-tRNA synthetase